MIIKITFMDGKISEYRCDADKCALEDGMVKILLTDKEIYMIPIYSVREIHITQ